MMKHQRPCQASSEQKAGLDVPEDEVDIEVSLGRQRSSLAVLH